MRDALEKMRDVARAEKWYEKPEGSPHREAYKAALIELNNSVKEDIVVKKTAPKKTTKKKGK